MNALGLYLRYTAVSIRMQMLYPASFLMLAVVQFIGPLVGLLGIWALFDRFGQIAGWGFGEVAVFYGVAHVSFSIGDAISRGFDVFGIQFIKTGDFDRLLLRPRTAALQVLSYELRLTRIGRLAQGLVVLGVALWAAQVALGVDDWLVLAGAIVGGAALFSAMLVLQATLSFWTVDSLEVANTLTYGGVEASQYPLDIYQRWFSTLLIAIIPLGCVTYFPVLYLLDRSDPLGTPDWFLPVAPLVGFAFLGFSLWVWSFGVRRYRSTGS